MKFMIASNGRCIFVVGHFLNLFKYRDDVDCPDFLLDWEARDEGRERDSGDSSEVDCGACLSGEPEVLAFLGL